MADIGAGTGFLGFLAAKLGAKRVDLYEAAEIADVARKLLRHNRLANCRIAQVHSTDVASPERVDVVVSETLGNYPFEENIIATLNDAHARFLEPGGVIIPHSVEQFVCPVTAERLYRELAAWDEVGYGLDFAPAKAMSLNNIYVRWFEPGRSAGRRRGGQRMGQGHLRPPQQDDARGRGELARRAGRPRSTAWRCGGRRSWRPASTLSTGPLAPRTHWEQLYLPALSPIAVAGRADPRRPPALHHLLRARAPT